MTSVPLLRHRSAASGFDTRVHLSRESAADPLGRYHIVRGVLFAARFAASLIALVATTACSGGDGADRGVPVLLRIEAIGTASVLFDAASTGNPPCSTGIARNAPIVFTFGGAVDPASVPKGGLANGSITIETAAAGRPRYPAGSFSVADDPALPSGNARRVVFTPDFLGPIGSAVPTSLAPASEYQLRVPKAGSGGAVLTVAGEALGNEAATCFTVCANGTANCLVDPVAGAPYVMETVPPSADEAPGTVAASSLGGRVRVVLSEALDASALPPILARLIDAATGSDIPGGAAYFAPGTPEAGPTFGLIEFVLATPVPSGTTIEIVLETGLQDLVGSPLTLYGGGAQGNRRVFRTAPTTYCPQPPIVESFDTTQSLSTTQGAVVWSGDGSVRGVPTTDIFGTGSFGPLVIPVGPSTIDTGVIVPPGPGGSAAAAIGVYETTAVLVSAGAVVRCIGPYPLTIRCQGSVVVAGTMNGRAGRNSLPLTGPPTPESGPAPGQFNNGGSVAALRAVRGGIGNLGGGNGGAASQADEVGPALRTPVAQSGFGGRIGGQPNPPGNGLPGFGGGGGGAGGFVAFAGMNPNGIGGFGGAGGSALYSGGDGGPTVNVGGNCQPFPIPDPTMTRALATGSVAAFAAPLSQAVGGSGGGGGGDRFDTNFGVNGDEQGGGGGGGGGAIRIIALGNVTIDASGAIDLSGAPGGAGNQFQAGHGGGGSGGQIWIQSSDKISIATAAVIDVRGGGPGSSALCSSQSAGAGGAGIIALEDADGVVNTNFVIGNAPAGVVAVSPFPFAAAIAGTATSRFFDSGYQSPDWGTPNAVVALGSAAGSTAVLSFQGARAAADGSVDLATLTAPVTGAQIDLLDGYRFIRFTVGLSSPLPTLPLPPGPMLPPRVDDLSIPWSAPLGCQTP